MLTIILDKGEYFQGQTIKGNVELVPDTDIYINDIELCFYLMEDWNYSISDEKTEKGNYKQCISLFKVGVNKFIPENDNKLIHLDPILHLFPFELKFPEFLYPSFEYPKHDFRAFLRYTLLATLKSPYIRLSTSKLIFIYSISLKDNNSFAIENTFNIKKWGIFGKGSTKLNVFLPMKCFIFSNDIPVKIEVDNILGKMKVTLIKINLIRKVILKDNKNDFKEKYSRFDKVCKKVYKVEVKIGKKEIFDFKFPLNEIPHNEFSFFDNVNLYNWTRRNCEFIPSIESTILSCQYSIKITIYYDSFVKKSDRPRIRLPISIVHKLENNTLLPMPNNNNINDNVTKAIEVNDDEIRKQKNSDFVTVDKNINDYNCNYNKPFSSSVGLNRVKTINNNMSYIDNISNNHKEKTQNQINNKPFLDNNNNNNFNFKEKENIEKNEKDNNNNIGYDNNSIINQINESQDQEEAPSCFFVNEKFNNNKININCDNNLNKEQKQNNIYKDINNINED